MSRVEILLSFFSHWEFRTQQVDDHCDLGRQPPTIASLLNPSLFTNSKYRRVSCLVCLQSTCSKKFSPTNFKNLKHLFVTVMWHSHLMSWNMKSPLRTRATDLKFLLIPIELPMLQNWAIFMAIHLTQCSKFASAVPSREEGTPTLIW